MAAVMVAVMALVVVTEVVLIQKLNKKNQRPIKLKFLKKIGPSMCFNIFDISSHSPVAFVKKQGQLGQ